MVLTLDLAPTILDVCRAAPLPEADGRSWKPLLEGNASGWRTAFLYQYNYEPQFPYTPNVRAIRTADWKYIRYPHGDGGPDRHLAELYDLRSDPLEMRNLVADPAQEKRVAELREQLHELMKTHRALPDPLPLDEGIKNLLPKF
ncbi:MAG: DUF4976 domain-containing protein [Verrucomicrobiota bacterium]|nr:DUF4976 domain-containing protein [Verrucomicrobiota bacterium]